MSNQTIHDYFNSKTDKLESGPNNGPSMQRRQAHQHLSGGVRLHSEGSCMARSGLICRKVSQLEFLYEQRHLRSAWDMAAQHASVGFRPGFGPVIAGLQAFSPSWVILQNTSWASSTRKGSRAADAAATAKASTSREASVGREWAESCAIIFFRLDLEAIRIPGKKREKLLKIAIMMATVGLPSLRSPYSNFRRIPTTKYRSHFSIHCSGNEDMPISAGYCPSFTGMRNVACGVLAACLMTAASPVVAGSQRLPPLSTEPDRCERAFVGNTIGQANGVYDKPLDLRFCDFTKDKTNLKGKTLSAGLMSDAKFDDADMSEVVMSKAYAVGASFKGTDFTNAVLDRVNFGKANLQGAIFKNAILSGSTFNDAQLQDAIFEDTIIGYIDLQKLCVNTTISEEGRAELGCR